jgi:sugar transferase EpsL
LLPLINVLKGDVILIGPRPLLMKYLPRYTEEQAKRHLVRPGISGWAQVNGRKGISADGQATMGNSRAIQPFPIPIAMG